MFTTKRGTPLDAKNVTHRFQALLKRLGLPRMRFHDLRHACASLLLAQGEHARVVMEILGHSQYAMTMNTYSNVLPRCGDRQPRVWKACSEDGSGADSPASTGRGAWLSTWLSNGVEAEHLATQNTKYGGFREGDPPRCWSGRGDLNSRPPEPHSEGPPSASVHSRPFCSPM